MSFVAPYTLLLLLPLALAGYLAFTGARGWAGQLPGAWQRIVSARLRPLIAERSQLGASATPVLCLAVCAIIVVALSRPGLDSEENDDFVTLAGRVVVLDVGSDLARHRHALDAIFRAGPGVATAIVAVSGDAYRIVPFTTDKAQIDRYVRVLSSDMMPDPGQRPHLGLARAEQILTSAGYLVRQVVLLTARPAPPRIVEIPSTDSQRYVVPLDPAVDWAAWAAAQSATDMQREDIDRIASDLERSARDMARAELPGSRWEFTTFLIALAGVVSLLLFRRRTS